MQRILKSYELYEFKSLLREKETMNNWIQTCEHRWDRRIIDGNPSATVDIANELVEKLPGFKGRWVYTCWIRPECPVWIGPFPTAQGAMDACDAHLESGHSKIFWPDEIADADGSHRYA
jgi:hypothetical protein